MKIRQLTSKDIPLASIIAGQNYSKKYEKLATLEMEAMFKNHAVKPSFLVAEEKGEIIAFGGYVQSWFDYEIYEMFWINVKQTHQNRGVGTALINKLISIVKKKKASLLIISASKPKYYSKKFGFKTLTEFGDQTLMSIKFKEKNVVSHTKIN